MSRILIGLTGQIGCGKTTVANFIKSETGAKELSFADPIKEVIAYLTGIPRQQLDDQEVKKRMFPDSSVTVRHALQTLGTEWGRELIDQDIWVNYVKRQIETEDQNFIVPDVRFENEAQMIRDLGGIIIHIRDEKERTDTHASEKRITNHWNDYFLVNHHDGIETLRLVVVDLLEHIYD